MKARVKATGEIVEVKEEYDLREVIVRVFYSNVEDPYEVYEKEELDFNVNDNIDPTIDYWTRLEHTYAGMAMQGILTNPIGFENIRSRGRNIQVETALLASEFAHALVEKMKQEREG